jgi:hypothetical protein
MWFTKKETGDSEIPDLPDLPSFPEQSPSLRTLTPGIGEKLPALPSLPNSETGNAYGREAIKAELNTEFQPGIPIKSYTKEITPEQKEVEIRRVPEVYQKQDQPVFIRLDRFQSSLKNFQEIKKQMQDIESYIADIKSIKSKEDAELEAWSKELAEVKAKLESIDSTLFAKLER